MRGSVAQKLTVVPAKEVDDMLYIITLVFSAVDVDGWFFGHFWVFAGLSLLLLVLKPICKR